MAASLGLGLAYLSVQKKLRDHLGLSGIRHTYTGGAAMGPDHFRFFHAIGVNLKQIYGQTEIAGISVVHRDGDIKFDTVGKPIPETEVRITAEGEIISKSPSVFLGYYKMPEETTRALRDGWLYSGDTGFFDNDGHLVVFDRSKDVMTPLGQYQILPPVPGDASKVQPLHQRCLGDRGPETFCLFGDLHRLQRGGQMGRRPEYRLYQLSGAIPETRGL